VDPHHLALKGVAVAQYVQHAQQIWGLLLNEYLVQSQTDCAV
jgi:hypothetical protein